MLDDRLCCFPHILHSRTVLNFPFRDIMAVLSSKLRSTQGSDDHVENLELTLKMHVLMKSSPLGRILVMRLQALVVMRMLSPALDRVDNLEVLADLLEWVILEAIVLFAV